MPWVRKNQNKLCEPTPYALFWPLIELHLCCCHGRSVPHTGPMLAKSVGLSSYKACIKFSNNSQIILKEFLQ